MGFNDLAEYMISHGANDKLANKQGYTCRNWKQPEGAAKQGAGQLSSPSGASANRRPITDKSAVNLPNLSPHRESESNKSRPAYKQDPRPVGGRARKKGRTSDIDATVYQRMYLALDDPPRSHSTPPGGILHVQDVSTQRPRSRDGVGEGAETRHSVQRSNIDGSVESSSHARPQAAQVGTSLQMKKRPVLKNPELPAKESSAGDDSGEAPGLTSIMKFVREGGTINEPFSLEAMRKLGVLPDQVAPIDRAELKKKLKDERLVEVRFKLLEERRQELLKQCVEERRRCKARSRDASLEELFIEYAGDMQLNISEFMEMLGKLRLNTCVRVCGCADVAWAGRGR